ncbi:WbqC family protein [bacterium AH-315-C07]|nr:WbqC family protein [bacterium AH-315-C07]
MTISIMQPYLFPYIGYFQLIHTSDIFVIYDDVKYIKEGWINRNRLLSNSTGQPLPFSLSVKKDDHDLEINRRFFSDKFSFEVGKLLKTIKLNYGKAPYFSEVFALLEDSFSIQELNIAKFTTACLEKTCNFIGIETEFKISSKLGRNGSLNGQASVLDINKILRSDHYVNPIGGIELYSKENFDQEGLNLSFLRSNDISYQQSKHQFVPSLSIIDVLMFNKKDRIAGFLDQYELV